MFQQKVFSDFRQKKPLPQLSKSSFEKIPTPDFTLEKPKWKAISDYKIKERKRKIKSSINELKEKKVFTSLPKIPSCFQNAKKKKKTNPNNNKQTLKEKEENVPKISSPLRTEIRSQPTQEFEINNSLFRNKPNPKTNNLILGTIPKQNDPIEKKKETKKIFKANSFLSNNPRTPKQKTSIFDLKKTNNLMKNVSNTTNQNKKTNPNLISTLNSKSMTGSKIEIEKNVKQNNIKIEEETEKVNDKEQEKEEENKQEEIEKENKKKIEIEKEIKTDNKNEKEGIKIEKENDQEINNDNKNKNKNENENEKEKEKEKENAKGIQLNPIPKLGQPNTRNLFQNTKKTGLFEQTNRTLKSSLFSSPYTNTTKPLNTLLTKKIPTNRTGLLASKNINLKSRLFSSPKSNTLSNTTTKTKTTTKPLLPSSTTTTPILGLLSNQNKNKLGGPFSKIGNKSKTSLFGKSELVKSKTGNLSTTKNNIFSRSNSKERILPFGKNQSTEPKKSGTNLFSGILSNKKSGGLFSNKSSLFKKNGLFPTRTTTTTPTTKPTLPNKQDTANNNKEDKQKNTTDQEDEEDEEDGTIVIKKICKVFELVDQVKKAEILKESQQKLMKSNTSTIGNETKETNTKPPVWKWEERGVGNLMVIERSDKNGHTLMMRRNPTKKIVINAPLFSGLNVKRNKKSLILNLKNYISKSSVENEKIGFTSFTVRTKTELDAQEIENEINKIVKKL
ncbi:hypothetical protein M0812_04899 [Anaeramoeba flamelloides]|uniref:RanBD1 domain-containing protein n=1 Tax=Anaeramoeba flamelloides TaxID=1746091 RepID=A0AAV8AAF5_9EUKA|nr:hypothetical protein M0812_04899 [Anaeramoeba flamelloides]